VEYGNLGMTTRIESEHLRASDLPGPDANYQELAQFALGFGAYKEVGPAGIVIAIAHGIFTTWQAQGELPVSLEVLRTALFGYQRNVHGSKDDEADEDDLAYMRTLVQQMRRVIASRP
jgi:hypothetical protein